MGQANGVSFPREYWEMLEKSAQFIASLGSNHNDLPQIGDSDDGQSLMFSGEDDDVQALVQMAAVTFKRAEFKKKKEPLCEAAFWVLGKRAQETFDSLEHSDSPDDAACSFKQGGYYILRGGTKAQVRLIFDCGPLGFGSIAAHGHADALSFILYVNDAPFFVDPGTYTYDKTNPLRNYFRSTAAHNTCVVDGLDQSTMTGPFLWSRKANAHIEELTSSDSVERVAGWHDGYQRFDDPVVHRRCIELDKEEDTISIQDIFEASKAHKFAMYFHLAPACNIEAESENCFVISNADKRIKMTMDARLRASVIRGVKDPVGGWYSASYDSISPTDTIVCEGGFEGRETFSTALQLAC